MTMPMYIKWLASHGEIPATRARIDQLTAVTSVALEAALISQALLRNPADASAFEAELLAVTADH